jgi:hypothetical protein
VFKEQPGREVIELSAEEGAKWAAAVRPMIDEKLAALKAAGLTGDYETYLKERITYWRGKAPSAQECSAWAAENVKAPKAK